MSAGGKSVGISLIAYQCHFCNQKFLYESLYNVHLKNNPDHRPVKKVIRKLRAIVAVPRRTACSKKKKGPFICKECNREFPDSRKLSGHSHERKPCPICNKIYSASNLLQHMKRHNPVEHICDLCGAKLINSDGLHQHMHYLHSDFRFECVKCQRQFRRRFQLKQHIKKDHDAYQCHFCNQKFLYESLYNVHLNNNPDHRPVKKVIRKLRAILPKMIVNADKRRRGPFICKECNKEFPSARKFSGHSHKKKACPICNKLYSANNLWQHLKRHNPVEHICDLCGAKLINSDGLQQHMNFMHSDFRFECVKCQRQFRKKIQLKQHIKKDHDAYRCHFCTQKFFYESLYNVHLKNNSDHRPVKKVIRKLRAIVPKMIVNASKRKMGPFVCKECNREFPSARKFSGHSHKKKACPICNKMYSASSLSHHVKRHDPVKQICGVCGAKLMNSESLYKHMYYSHNQYRFECVKCRKKFRRKFQLNVHIKRDHDAYQCPNCNQIFFYESLYNVHLKNNPDHRPVKVIRKLRAIVPKKNANKKEGPFICSKCNREFASSKKFRAHTHDRKPCPICNQMYSVSNLLQHMKRHNDQTRVCDLCGSTLKNADGLRRHLYYIHHNYRFECNLCDRKFRGAYYLTMHIKKDHEAYKCHFCNKTFFYESLYTVHLENNPNHNRRVVKIVQQIPEPNSKFLVMKKPFSCKKCNRRFANKRNFKAHLDNLKACLNARAKVCDLCGTKAGNNDALQRHMKAQHPGEPFIKKKNNVDDTCSKDPIPCTKCGRVFYSRTEFHRHGHIPRQCPVCKKVLASGSFYYHVRSHQVQEKICEVCGSKFKNADCLRIHNRVQHEKLRHECDVCHKKFRQNSHLKLHIKKDHDEHPDVVCEICGKKFYTTKDLKTHIQGKHEKLRPYLCEFCKKNFSSKHALQTHRRQHTLETPYKCEYCTESFRQKISLRGHLKSKHNVIEEIVCKCKTCGRGFSSNMALKTHRRMKCLS